jgi:hypothetical protein
LPGFESGIAFVRFCAATTLLRRISCQRSEGGLRDLQIRARLV